MLCVLILSACEKPVIDEDTVHDDAVVFSFILTFKDTTRGNPASFFTKLNVQIFDADGQKVFDKVKPRHQKMPISAPYP